MGQKRKHGSDGTENDEIASALKELPVEALWRFRQDLSLLPYSSALQSLQETSPKMGEMLLGVKAEDVARSLGIALGGDLKCWCFDSTSDEIDAAHQALRTMLEEGRKKLLNALRNGESFCAAVKNHSSKKDGQPLMKLGRTRVMWLLGSGPEEGNHGNQSSTGNASGARRSKRRSGKKREALRKEKDAEMQVSEDSDVDSSHDEPLKEKEKTRSETLKFLESIKGLREGKRQKQKP